MTFKKNRLDDVVKKRFFFRLVKKWILFFSRFDEGLKKMFYVGPTYPMVKFIFKKLKKKL